MTTTPPTLAEWHGLKPPEICTVASLQRYIPHRYDQVYWIRKMISNVVVESYPLTDWHFAANGKLVGTVDTGGLKLNVSIHLDEFVVLSVK
jgi:hypothetical protein